LEQLRALICAADEREPEAERREGVTLVEDIAALMGSTLGAAMRREKVAG
jgi:hypothetical protein